MDEDRLPMMSRNGGSRHPIAAWLVVVLLFPAVMVSPLGALERDDAGMDSRWTRWLDCWELVLESVDHREEMPPETVLVCLSPDEAEQGVRITTLAEGEVVLEESFFADGERRPAEEPGCRGWQSAEWSRDGHRLFMFSETTCEEGSRRFISGLSWIAANGTWLDIQAIESADLKELVVRQYRRAGAELTQEAGAAGVPVELMTGPLSGTKGSGLDVDDVIEACQKIDLSVVEAALVESETRISLNADTLVMMADSNVPKDVIDLMVAMSYPDHFQVGRARRGGGGGFGDSGIYGLGFDAFDPFYRYSYHYPFYYAPFGFYSYWYAPYGGYYVLVPVEPEADSGGRAVKGRGYTRVQPKEARPREGGAWAQGREHTSRDGSSSGVSEGGYRSTGGSSSGRTAKPKKN